MNVVQVVAAADDRYAQHLAVMIASLLANSASKEVHFHLLVPPTFKSRTQIIQVCGTPKRVSFYSVSDVHTFDTLKQRKDITSATYYRLAIGELLPMDLTRVIFLDCDVIVRTDLVELWELDLAGNVLAATPDPGFDRHSILGLPIQSLYFNAGVLLIDLARWRREEIGAAALRFAADNPDRLSYNDQCALNLVVQGRWISLDRKWNFMTQHLGRDTEQGFVFSSPVNQEAKAAGIMHFNEPGRPWLYMSRHPFKKEYERYLSVTPWQGFRPPDRYPHNIIIKNLSSLLPAAVPLYLRLRRIF